MLVLKQIVSLALAITLISCGPSPEEMARTKVVATEEFERAVAAALQETAMAQPSETSRSNEKLSEVNSLIHTPTDAPTQTVIDEPTSSIGVDATDLVHVTWDEFVHLDSGIKFDHPADWSVIADLEVVHLEGDNAHIVVEDIASRNDGVGLEQVVTDMFELDRDYIDESGVILAEPAGYTSTGRFVSDNSRAIRFVIDYPGYGLIHWILRTSDNILSDEHIFVIENMMASLVLPQSETKDVERKVVETNLNTSMEIDDDTLCATYTNADLRIFEAPENTITKRCKVEAGNIVIDFNGYEGVNRLLYEEVAEAIFTAAELFPIPLDTFDGVGQVVVAIWHQSKSELLEVAQHRCSYVMPGLGERCWSEFMRPGGIGMARLSQVNEYPVLFEVVWPTLDTHIDRDITHWQPAAHEWIHIYQSAHVVKYLRSDVEGFEYIPLIGPVWMLEGFADFFGLLISDQVGEDDFTTRLFEWFEYTNRDYMVNSGVAGSNVLLECSTPMQQVEAEERGNPWQCVAGRVAIVRLLDLAGAEPMSRFRNYYKDLAEFGWEESFLRSFGRTAETFYEEFGEFLEQPLEQQKSIISKPILIAP